MPQRNWLLVFRLAGHIASAAVFGVSCLVLAGSALKIETLKSVVAARDTAG